MNTLRVALMVALFGVVGCNSVPTEITLKNGMWQDTVIPVTFHGVGIRENAAYKRYEEHPDFVEQTFMATTFLLADRLGETVTSPLKNPATWVPMEAHIDNVPGHPECTCERLFGMAKNGLGVEQLVTYRNLTCGGDSDKNSSELVKGHARLSTCLSPETATPSNSPGVDDYYCFGMRGPCDKENKCIASAGKCVVATNETCGASSLCKRVGWCTKKEEKVPPVLSDSHGGRASTSVCRAGSEASCRQSDDCEGQGKCGYTGGDYCVAVSEEDCRNSGLCGRAGRCKLQGDECVAGSDEACKKSKVCKEDGWCVLNAKKGNCAKSAE